MPSASAKVEKVAVLEATDPLKQFANMLEKRMRNLEKRKIKLDNYRSDVENGKELNEDQKMAVSKYDSVIGVLDFARDLSKAMNSIVLESGRQQKKQAKKEQLERQQHEIQRLQEAFIYCHILSCFQNEDVRSDFLNGENGAVQLTSEQLSQLDQLYKLIGPSLPNEQEDLTSHFHVLAENHIFLVEGRNKEIAGTTYKVLKDLLVSIKACGYFSRPSETLDDGTSSEEMPEEAVAEPSEVTLIMVATIDDEREEVIEVAKSPSPIPVKEEPHIPASPSVHPALQEVLAQSTFNFLQQSQVDLDTPHMDPAVVAVHQMAPPPTVNFINYPPAPPTTEQTEPLVNGNVPIDVMPTSPVAISHTVAPVLTSVHHGGQIDFDPSHPIPTQTFTNQSFAVMQNMIMPQAYVPVTMHHGPLPPHITPMAVVPGASSAPATVVPLSVPVPVAVQEGVVPNVSSSKSRIVESQTNGELSPEADANSNDLAEKGTEGYTGYRGGFRGRGRGRGNNNGYFRGRSSYHNGRGGYQNHYYQDRNGYNGNFRRGNNRGGPRGSGNGNNRARGSYRTQSNQPQQQQQQPQQSQQAQQ